MNEPESPEGISTDFANTINSLAKDVIHQLEGMDVMMDEINVLFGILVLENFTAHDPDADKSRINFFIQQYNNLEAQGLIKNVTRLTRDNIEERECLRIIQDRDEVADPPISLSFFLTNYSELYGEAISRVLFEAIRTSKLVHKIDLVDTQTGERAESNEWFTLRKDTKMQLKILSNYYSQKNPPLPPFPKEIP